MKFKTVGGLEFQADEDDSEFILNKKWYHFKTQSGYYIHTYNDSKNKKKIWLHRLLTNTNDTNLIIDHKNRDTTDNRKDNLRICTKKDNRYNSGPNYNNITGYKGVQLRKDTNKYRAVIRVEGKLINLGQFDNPKEAAIAYNEAAKKYFGEYAFLNEIDNEV